MAGNFLIDSIQRSLRERARRRRVQLAAGWPQATAHINLWKVLPAGDAAESFAKTDFIEAGFHFVLNGEFYGGYVRSVAMGRREAEKLAVGDAEVTVRYNPDNPDQTAVLAEDNPGKLPFEVVSG
jgi:hypothetical protein